MQNLGNPFRRILNSRRVVAVAVGFATVSGMIACSTDRVSAPAAPGATRAAMSPEDSMARFTRDSIEFALAAARDSAKAAEKAEHDLAKAQLDSLKADWEADKRAVKRKEGKAEVLRCAPQPRASVTKVIGPKGGSFNFGPHQFVVPAGALGTNVTITGTAPSNPTVNVEFEPHGLPFKRPVQMTVDYKQCIVPDSVELGVTYLRNGWYAVEKMPSADVRKDKRIIALTDHFSGYAVTWGIRGAQ